MGDVLTALAGLSATIFSPAKMVFIAYVLLTYHQGHTCWWVFGIVSVIFFFAEILHNDYWRIKLNIRAESARMRS